MRGADLLVHVLRDARVDTIFTLSGNQIMPVFDACIDAGIKLVHVRHEAAAVYMADGWAQLTGNLGVALVTAGPGFANCLSPLYSARANESPVLLLSGDSPIAQDGRGAFQELAQTAMSGPVTKISTRVMQVDQIQRTTLQLMRAALSGRPGPVHLALPVDVLNAVGETATAAYTGKNTTTRDAALAGKITGFLGGCDKPVALMGPALTRCCPDLNALSDRLQTPVISIQSPRGLRDPSLGSLKSVLMDAQRVMFLCKEIDFSAGFGQTPWFGEHCEFMVVDPEVEMLDRARRLLGERLVCCLQADPRQVSHSLSQTSIDAGPNRRTWRERITQACASRSRNLVSTSNRILPTALCDAVQRLLDAADEPVLVCDGGEFGQWAQALLQCETRLINGPAGAIGGGLCYAIAAKMRRPSATVVALMGDGTVGFHLSEFETAVRLKTPIIAIVGNDARWNAEYQIQLRDYGPDRLIGCELEATRYDLAVQGLGGHGEHVAAAHELEPALTSARDSGLPACVNVEIESLAAP